MNNEKKLYDICLKMIKDKHKLNEYSIDKFNTFYFQVFNNSNENDNINDLNKLVLKKINEDIIFNSKQNDTIQNKIIELQNIRANMNMNANANANMNGNVNANINANINGNVNANINGNEIINNEIINDDNDLKISSSANIKYIKIDNLANNNGRSFIINTIKNNFNINNKYNNNKIFPSYLCIPSIIKKYTPYIIIGIMDEHTNITYTFILDKIGDTWDIWKPVNDNYININVNSSQWNISLYDYTNNYIDLKQYYVNVLEILEINNLYKIKVSNPNFFNIHDNIKIIFNNNILIDNTIINKDNENNIYINMNNIKIEQFINSKIFNLKYQLSIIFKIFPI
jgi:hypothetical protein